MNAIVTLIITSIALYLWALKKPEILIVYIAFFFSATDILLDSAGIQVSNLLTKLLIICVAVILFQIKTNFRVISLRKLMDSMFFKGLCFFIAMGLIESLYSYSYTAEKMLMVRNIFLYNLIPLSLFIVFYRAKSEFQGIPLQITIMTIITAFIVYVFVDTSVLVVGVRTTLGRIGVDSISLAQLAVVSFIMSILQITYNKKVVIRLICITSALLSLYILLFSAQRGPLIGLAVALLLWLLFKSRIQSSLKPVFSLVLIATAVLAFNIEQFGVTERFADLARFQEYERYNDIYRSFDLFSKKPIFGHGVLGYLENTGRAYPHNVFLEVMVEYGMLGIIVLTLMIREAMMSVYKIFKNEQTEYGELALALCWVALFISAQFSGNLSGNNYFYAISGLVYACARSASLKEKGQQRLITNTYAMKNLKSDTT